jgi:hypothetical protein
MDSTLRGRWEPEAEVDLLRAFNEGMLEERSWCDLKRKVENTKNGNKELARDLASFAIDGGTLIIGLDEAEPGGNPLHPVVLAGLPERVEQIALNRIDPPLVVSCTLVKSEADKSTGYLLIHVPASAMAPHQVGGVYYGRGDKTKRALPDPEVQRIFARRAEWTKGIEVELNAAVHSDPFTERSQHGHMFLVARPIGAWPNIFQDFVTGPAWQANLLNMKKLACEDSAVLQGLGAMYPHEPVDLPFSSMFTTRRTSNGAILTSRGVNMSYNNPVEAGTLDFEVYEDGRVRFFYGGAVRNAQGKEPNSTREPRANLLALVLAVRAFIETLNGMSGAVSYAAMWDIGLSITDLKGAYGIVVNNSFGASAPETWSGGLYERTTRTSVAELGKMPALPTERLVGRLLRAYSAEAQMRPLLST